MNYSFEEYIEQGIIKKCSVNNGPNHAVGKVTVTFNEDSLPVYGNSVKNMPVDQNVSFDFTFNPSVAGTNLPINATITFG